MMLNDFQYNRTGLSGLVQNRCRGKYSEYTQEMSYWTDGNEWENVVL